MPIWSESSKYMYTIPMCLQLLSLEVPLPLCLCWPSQGLGVLVACLVLVEITNVMVRKASDN